MRGSINVKQGGVEKSAASRAGSSNTIHSFALNSYSYYRKRLFPCKRIAQTLRGCSKG